MEDVRELKELQLDALREVANIGAGHAATALSQMTNRTIMIAVPEVNVRPLEEVTDLVGRPDEVVAAVLMHMMGDLTGRTLVMFDEAWPERSVIYCSGGVPGRPASSTRWSSRASRKPATSSPARTSTRSVISWA